MFGQVRHHFATFATLLAVQIFEKDEEVCLVALVHDLLDPILIGQNLHSACIVLFVFCGLLGLAGYESYKDRRKDGQSSPQRSKFQHLSFFIII